MLSFLIVFILYTLIDISWVYFVNSVKEENINISMISSGLIAVFSLISGWQVYVNHSIGAIIGTVTGSIAGVYIGYKLNNIKGKNSGY